MPNAETENVIKFENDILAVFAHQVLIQTSRAFFVSPREIELKFLLLLHFDTVKAYDILSCSIKAKSSFDDIKV